MSNLINPTEGSCYPTAQQEARSEQSLLKNQSGRMNNPQFYSYTIENCGFVTKWRPSQLYIQCVGQRPITKVGIVLQLWVPR